MNVRTYTAGSMAEALEQVKHELGREAVILHTRKVYRGGWLGFAQRELVEITASNDVSIVPPRMRRSATAPEPAAPGALLRKTYTAHDHAPEPAAAAATATTTAIPPATTGAPDSAVAAPDDAMRDEIRQIRGMVHRMMQRQSEQPSPNMPETLFNHYLALLEQEVADELATEIIDHVHRELDDQRLHDAEVVRQAVAAQLASLVPVCGDTEGTITTQPGRPRVIALVGPTGVGKTTTLAKLAATLKLRQNKNVALLTIDTYRIAAVDQLRTYAEIIDVPLHVVLSPEQMGEALARCGNADVVLIDTAGRSQRDDDKLDDLCRFMQAAQPDETHLVLASTCAQSVLMETVERFSALAIDRVIFTKLDEAVSFGMLLNVVRKVDKQLSYITTGQEVPHQIEAGRSQRLAELIMGGGLA